MTLERILYNIADGLLLGIVIFILRSKGIM